MPAGAFTVINGDKEAVDALIDDPRVAALSFVGSTPVARYLRTGNPASSVGLIVGQRQPEFFLLVGHEMLIAGDQEVGISEECGVEDRIVLRVRRQRRHGSVCEGRCGDHADRLHLTSQERCPESCHARRIWLDPTVSSRAVGC